MEEKFNLKTRECELKYRANNIPLAQFQAFAENLNPKKIIYAESYDTYYKAPSFLNGSGVEFMRFREGDKPELTFKIKLDQENNQDRIEVDLPLSKQVKKFIIDKFMGALGFIQKFQIYKNCYIYYVDRLVIVYYQIKKHEDGDLLDKFIEIEARKDAKFGSIDEVWALIDQMEEKMGEIGVYRKNRLKDSIWDMYKDGE